MGNNKISKWSQYHVEAEQMATEGVSATKIAKLIFEKYKLDLSAQDNFRRYICKYLIRRGLREKTTSLTKDIPQGADNVCITETDDTLEFDYKGLEKLQTVDDVIKFAKIDMSLYTTGKVVSNKWGKFYQIKVEFIKIKQTSQEVIDDVYAEVKKHLSKRKLIPVGFDKMSGTNIGVVPLADFHIGAYIRNLVATPDFDIARITDMLDEIADTINGIGYKEVHMPILGDLIESFTGLNHINSWKGIEQGMYGSNLVITAFEIIESFLSKIENLTAVYMISGNHDRSTSNNKEDGEGDICAILAYFMNRHLPITVEYHPLVISKVIDKICYVFTHGHHGFSKKSIETVIWRYGNQKYFNVVLQGHDHSRKKKEPVINMETVYSDSGTYRGITCPSLFTGNMYSESIGFTSTAGYLIISNRHNKPQVIDIPLA